MVEENTTKPICEICDGDCYPEHKSLADKQTEWAFANAKKENPEMVHFQTYSYSDKKFIIICEVSDSISKISDWAITAYLPTIICKKCKTIAKEYLKNKT